MDVHTPCARMTKSEEMCHAGPRGGPAEGVEMVDGLWYCKRHRAAAKAVSTRRRDQGYGICSAPGCKRFAAEPGGRCIECRAGIRAVSSSPTDAVITTNGRGDHPYAEKSATLYLVIFPQSGLIKLGKSTTWGARGRITEARRHHDESPAIRERLAGRDGTSDAYKLKLADGEPMLWAESERIEHAAAGRLAVLTDARSVAYEIGKEWLEHPAISTIDWSTAFHSAVSDTLDECLGDVGLGE